MNILITGFVASNFTRNWEDHFTQYDPDIPQSLREDV